MLHVPLPATATALALVLSLATAAGLRAGLVPNGDFESPLGPVATWTPRNAVPVGAVSPPTTLLTRLPGARPGGAGAWTLEITGRDHVQDGPSQGSAAPSALLAALVANGNQRSYTTRVWVKLDAAATEASVRCLLRWTDNGVAQPPLILAEAVLTQPGVWVEATATTTLAWSDSLTGARIEFEVEALHRGAAPNPPADWFPVYQLDDLAMELDDDRDGLWNSEESFDHTQNAVSFADNSDSDGDRLSDNWEIAHALNPRDPSDAALDFDQDGFTNLEEFFAATNPRDGNSFPGRASNPNATHATRALLRYLALRPARQQALVGQMISDNSTEYSAYVAALAAQPGWGRWPAILGLAVEKIDAPLDIVASIDLAIPYAIAGGLVQIKWAMWNPWRAQLYQPNQQFGVPGDNNQIDVPGLLNPLGTSTTNNTAAENLAARAVLLGWIDSVAAELIRYREATDGAPMLFRPLSEMNGGWFWWGHRSRAEYLGLWNFIRDRLELHYGLNNLIWVYESASTEHIYTGPQSSSSASDYYYPGDERVDVMTHNLYDDDWVLDWDANKIYSRYPKIYGVPQAGPGKNLPTSRDGSFDNRAYAVQIAARYPRMSFFIVWNSFTTGGGATHNHLAIIDNAFAEELLSDPRIVTRDELRWQAPHSFEAFPASSDSLAALWLYSAPAEQAEAGFRLEIAASSTGPWTLAQTLPFAARDGLANGLLADSSHWLRVRALFSGDEDSLATDPVTARTWTRFAQWRFDQLGADDADPGADPDGDGLANALEYLLSTNPADASSATAPVVSTIDVAGEHYLTLTYRRRSDAQSVAETVQASGDLMNWNEPTALVGAPLDHLDGTETVTYRDLVPLSAAPTRFLRLALTIDP